MKRLSWILVPAIILFASACGKNGGFSSTPSLTFKSIGPGEIHSGDSLLIECNFTDKEGDIQDSVYYRASNSGEYASYAIPNFPKQPNLKGNIILELYGGLDFTVPPGGGIPDSIYFNVFIKDVKGHSSDTVQTTPIIVYGD